MSRNRCMTFCAPHQDARFRGQDGPRIDAERPIQFPNFSARPVRACERASVCVGAERLRLVVSAGMTKNLRDRGGKRRIPDAIGPRDKIAGVAESFDFLWCRL